jgi:RNA polymerase sigma-70 factor (ECF subfamily)
VEAGRARNEESDGRVFAEYYEQWSGAVYRYLVHLVGRTGEADDLFQETWAKALERRDQLRDPKLFSVWIFRIARNLAFNEMRKSRRKGQVWILSNLANPQDEETEDLLDRLPHPGPDPLSRTMTRERREIVQRAIAELDLTSQEMFQLRYFEGFSLAEIAQVLDVPLGTVCTKIHRGLKAIQDSLVAQGIRTLEEI